MQQQQQQQQQQQHNDPFLGYIKTQVHPKLLWRRTLYTYYVYLIRAIYGLALPFLIRTNNGVFVERGRVYPSIHPSIYLSTTIHSLFRSIHKHLKRNIHVLCRGIQFCVHLPAHDNLGYNTYFHIHI